MNNILFIEANGQALDVLQTIAPAEKIPISPINKCLSIANTCNGSCAIPYSKCGQIISANNSKGCGCLYCNYDAVTKRCGGTCPSINGQINSLNKCLNKVLTPKSNADCGCAPCLRKVDINGNLIGCSGTCYASGLKCQIGPVLTSSGYVKDCYCQ